MSSFTDRLLPPPGVSREGGRLEPGSSLVLDGEALFIRSGFVLRPCFLCDRNPIDIAVLPLPLLML